ncbi:uncharacterized protein LOC115274554 [Suricata suricatta]|uniref:uncharacterized protein LOC115274554 n=1 Tax=Suricata suricatta TaxID=37032 RepID=UPI0011560B77|nr:uncharacterized protein LOC115274554 [Suricata suricatta]
MEISWGRGGARAVERPGWGGRGGRAGAGGRAGVASAPPGGGAGGLGRAQLRGGDCGGRVNRPQPAPEEGEHAGRLGACEARHGGVADEPLWPRVFRKGGGARTALITTRSLPARLLRDYISQSAPRGARGNEKRQRYSAQVQSLLWLYKRSLGRFSFFFVFGSGYFPVGCIVPHPPHPMRSEPGNAGLLPCMRDQRVRDGSRRLSLLGLQENPTQTSPAFGLLTCDILLAESRLTSGPGAGKCFVMSTWLNRGCEERKGLEPCAPQGSK